MSFRVRRCLTPLFLTFLVVLIATSAAVNAQTSTGVSTTRVATSAAVNVQTSTGVSTAHVDFGTLGRGGSAEQDVTLTNLVNNSTVTYSITFTNITNTSGQLTATPSQGSIGPKSNVTIAVRLNVASDAREGSFNSSMVVNESTTPNVGGGSTTLPAVVAQVTYIVQAKAPARTALSSVDVPLVTGVLGVSALVAIAVVYFIFKRT